MAKSRAEITRDQKKRYRLAGLIKVELIIDSTERQWFLEQASESRLRLKQEQKKSLSE